VSGDRTAGELPAVQWILKGKMWEGLIRNMRKGRGNPSLRRQGDLSCNRQSEKREEEKKSMQKPSVEREDGRGLMS